MSLSPKTVSLLQKLYLFSVCYYSNSESCRIQEVHSLVYIAHALSHSVIMYTCTCTRFPAFLSSMEKMLYLNCRVSFTREWGGGGGGGAKHNIEIV